mmetsp:Transcript_18367/g.57220  ORF Transcript_18367/g.57220 Transcript_18367/m.57220 type:complete len:202 (+) Transcript_18367:205-810(+)
MSSPPAARKWPPCRRAAAAAVRRWLRLRPRRAVVVALALALPRPRRPRSLNPRRRRRRAALTFSIRLARGGAPARHVRKGRRLVAVHARRSAVVRAAGLQVIVARVRDVTVPEQMAARMGTRSRPRQCEGACRADDGPRRARRGPRRRNGGMCPPARHTCDEGRLARTRVHSSVGCTVARCDSRPLGSRALSPQSPAMPRL